jgi:hypothetical protein
VATFLPEPLIAIRIYVVLDAGDTEILPEESTVPIPGSMVTEVAFDTFQLRVVELPADILGGLAIKELITGRLEDGGCVVDGDVPETTILVVAVILPALFVAVRT